MRRALGVAAAAEREVLDGEVVVGEQRRPHARAVERLTERVGRVVVGAIGEVVGDAERPAVVAGRVGEVDALPDGGAVGSAAIVNRGSEAPDVRERIEGLAAVEAALAGGAPVRCLVVADEPTPSPEIAELCERAVAQGIRVDRVAPRRARRLTGDADVAALLGPVLDADLDDVMDRGGAVWLLVGAAYPGNVGTALRSAEVSGADGVYIDNAFDHEQRREARRASMRADRFLPVAWDRAGDVIGAARRAGKRIVAVEDVGDAAPWHVDLTGSVLLMAGGEADGIPAALLRRCDHIVRIPMAGFVTSYNLQAAVAVLAVERLRQIERGSA